MKLEETNSSITTENSSYEETVEKDHARYEEQNPQQNEGGEGANYSVNFAILGGLVGAGIGLLVNPETSKKLVRNLGESEFVKVAGKEFKKTAQELLADQAQSSFKQLAMGCLTRVENGIPSPEKGKENGTLTANTPAESPSSKFENIKEENKHLNQRLEKIEKMLGELVESK